ncbi:PWI domain-containing protein [Xylariaceae sp. FL0016]|nr:PWI domain-containing protein [Xylariaceae sp. FL0016]
MATTRDAKLMRNISFPDEFNKKLDRSKVNWHVMKKWIATRSAEILKFEDDVFIELCYNLLNLADGDNTPQNQRPAINPKKFQIDITGFLQKDTPDFCKEFWNLCLSAQSSPQNVPPELLEAKKLELIQEKVVLDTTIYQERSKLTRARSMPTKLLKRPDFVVKTKNAVIAK